MFGREKDKSRHLEKQTFQSNEKKSIIIHFSRRIIIAIAMVIVFILVLYLFIDIINSEFQTYSQDESVISWTGKDRITIALIGTEKDGEIEYIDYLGIIEFEPEMKEIRHLVVNPGFTPFYSSNSKYLTLRNSLISKDYSSVGEGVDLTISGLKSMLAIKIDGYILINKDEFINLLSGIGQVKIESPSYVEDIDFPDGFIIQEGVNYLNSIEYILYLAADVNGLDDKFMRQISGFHALRQKLILPRWVFNYNIIHKDLIQSVRTNIDYISFLKMLIKLRQDDQYQFQNAFLKQRQGYIVETGFGDIWRPVYEDIDKDVQKIFTNREAKVEQARIDVLNATNFGGLAKIRGRRLNNRGLRVVLYGNHSENIEMNKVYVDEPEKYYYTLHEIEKSLDGKIDIINESYEGRTVSDIVIILGNNEIN